MMRERIHVDAPTSDARRDRVERGVFGQLAAIRAADRAETYAPPRRSRWLAFAIPATCVATLAIVLAIVFASDRTESVVSVPSLVETPVGGGSRFTVGDAVIDARGDTSVAVQKSEAGVVLVLGRGSVDCDVTPRDGRPPFRVIAGNVTVEVVGTRFAVTRVGEGARVDVTRGKVRVRSDATERMLGAGESWTPTQITALEPAPIIVKPEPVIDPEPAPPVVAPRIADPTTPAAPVRPSSQEAYNAAQALEFRDVRKAATAYRTIANGRDSWAALALYALAEAHLEISDAPAALQDLDELTRRFPNHANAQDAAWLRVTALRRTGQAEVARRAAADYLAKFPNGTYAGTAAKLAAPP